jgi:hypothetical protein
MAKTISNSTTGPVVLQPTDNPLTITGTGAVNATGSGVDGIDGPAGTTWNITNAGRVASSGGDGVSLASSGSIGNSGAISGVDGIVLRAGGSVTNLAGGSISASGARGSGFGVGAGVYVTGAAGTVTNNATISGGGYGVALAHGGTVTNNASILGAEDGVIFQGGVGALTNSGDITGTVDDGVALFSGGSVTNAAGKSISGLGTNGAGVFITGAAGTVTNNGSIAGANHFGVLVPSRRPGRAAPPPSIWRRAEMSRTIREDPSRTMFSAYSSPALPARLRTTAASPARNTAPSNSRTAAA